MEFLLLRAKLSNSEEMLISLTFLFWLCIAGAVDVVYRRCFNWLVVSGLISLLIFSVISPESYLIEISIQEKLIGSAGAFLILLVFYSFGMMGAGDVKFAAVLGLWVGWELLLPIWALSCAFSVLHGSIARSNLKYFFASALRWRDGSEGNGRRFIPYVTYLSAATVIVLMLSK